MDPLESGEKFSPRQDTDWDTSVQFLPASDPKHVEKKPCRRRLWVGVGLLLSAAAVALLTGLLVWRFHLRNNVQVKRLYIGSMEISNQRFLAAHEDPNSPQFRSLASLVSQQLTVIYSQNSVLSKYFGGSTVQAFRYGAFTCAPLINWLQLLLLTKFQSVELKNHEDQI